MKALNRRHFLATGAATLAAPSIVRAQGRVLSISSFLPRGHVVPVYVLEEWIGLVQNETRGRVSVEILEKPLGPPPQQFPLLQDGTADIAYALHGYSGADAFLRARIGQFSFLGDAYSASQAFAEVYEGDLDAAEEHAGIKLLATFQHGPGALFLRGRSIDRIEDFEGLRIRTSGGYIAELMNDLGAINVAMPPTRVREAFETDLIDAVAFPYEGAASFGIIDLLTEVSEIRGGYYNATWFLGTSQAAWGTLSDRDQQVVEQLSRELVPLLAAKAFDFADYEGREQCLAAGVPVKQPSSQLFDQIRQKGLRYEAEWVEQVAAQGYDGQAALDRTRHLTAVDR